MRFLTLMPRLAAASDAGKFEDLMAAKEETVAFANVTATRRITSSTVTSV